MKLIKLILTITAFAGLTTFANGQALVGGGVGFATDGLDFGIWARGGYQFTENWRAVGTFTYFFNVTEVLNTWDLNFDAHYIFVISDRFQAYPLAGLNITTLNPTGDGSMRGLVDETDFSLNLGGGVEFLVNDRFSIPVEVKLVLGPLSRLWAGVGVHYLFGSRP